MLQAVPGDVQLLQVVGPDAGAEQVGHLVSCQVSIGHIQSADLDSFCVKEDIIFKLSSLPDPLANRDDKMISPKDPDLTKSVPGCWRLECGSEDD